MDELEEVKKELAALQDKGAKMEQAKKNPDERWKPIGRELYQIIFADGQVNTLRYDGDAIDRVRVDSGNAFPPDMPLDNVVMMHRFINEMELICWQLGVTSSQGTVAAVIESKCGKICYKFDFIDQRDKAYSMLSDKVKEWVQV